MDKDSYEHGVPSWVDLGTPDLEGARVFYAGLFGWTIPDADPEAGGYTLAQMRGRPVAGLGPQQNPGPPYWTTYVTVDDADAASAAVTNNGGNVLVAPFDVMGLGKMGVFADPAGAVFAVWQPIMFTGAGVVNEVGAYAWSELMTTDVEGAKAFYNAVFGWGELSHGEPGQMGAYTEWKLGDRSIGGMMAKPPMMPAEVPPFWGIYFLVADTDAAVAKVTELGGRVVVGPMDIEPGRFAGVMDPAGAYFNVMTLSEQPDG